MAPILALLTLALATYANAADDTSILTNEIGRTSNESLLWGPYKPNLYFGVRPRIPLSLAAGLLWAKVDNFKDVQNNFRHTCETHAGISGYGWEEYDIRKGGQQTIHDDDNNLDLTTKFVKVPGGTNGGSWGIRVIGKLRENAPKDLKTTVIFYATLEGMGSLSVKNEKDELGYEDDVVLEGSSDGLGDYTITVTEGKGGHPTDTHESYKSKPLDRAIVHSSHQHPDVLWQIKPLLFKLMKEEIDIYIKKYGEQKAPPPWQIYTIANDAGDGNVHYVQKTFEGAFEYDILFSSGSAEVPLTSEILTAEIENTALSFRERFSTVFPLQAPFNKDKYQEFAKSMFSNLMGGIGYFYGNSVVDKSFAPEYEEENEGFHLETAAARARGNTEVAGPDILFTSVPSRPFFPRGFLWDEGFHLLPIADWDMDVALQIVKSWFNLIDEDGWIGREQILGDEARSKVPAEFQVQYPHYANPPTLFLMLDSFLERLSHTNGTGAPIKESLSKDFQKLQTVHLDNPEVSKQYLENLYPLLKRQYEWFRRTQFGDLKSYDHEAFSSKEGYRWRGRTPSHILTSGLDDYPRAQPPHPGELHVDLISWVGMMAKSLEKIATFLDITDDAEQFEKQLYAIRRNIDDLHWSSKAKTYCDTTIDDFEESVHFCHKGYVSIFPFLTGLMEPDNKRLGDVLKMIGDKNELWSNHGLKSLSESSEFHMTGENYWRSPVWVNINYLAVKQLLDLAQSSSPHKKEAARLYTDLRKNLVNTIYESWKKTGFAWEQYDPETGEGKRTQHFTGWTSLVVKIMAMPDISGSKSGGKDEL